MQITSQKAPQNTSQITSHNTSQNTSHSLFEKEFKRYVATRNYHHAFLYCLNNLQSNTYYTIAKNSAYMLIDNYSYLLFEGYKRYKNILRFVINKKIDKNWLVDALINQGIKDMQPSSMSIGYVSFFNRISCYRFENTFTSCSIGMVQKNNTSVIYYDFSFFRTNHDVVKAVCKEIVKLYACKWQ